MIKLHTLYAIMALMIRKRIQDESKPVGEDPLLFFLLCVLGLLVSLCLVLVYHSDLSLPWIRY